MTNKEFQDYMKQFPDNMEVMVFNRRPNGTHVILPAKREFAIKWSDTAKYDEEKDKTTYGNGRKYILLNAPVS